MEFFKYPTAMSKHIYILLKRCFEVKDWKILAYMQITNDFIIGQKVKICVMYWPLRTCKKSVKFFYSDMYI